MGALDKALGRLNKIITQDLTLTQGESSYPEKNAGACLSYLVGNLEKHPRVSSAYVDQRYGEIKHIFEEPKYAFSGRDGVKRKVESILDELKKNLNQGLDMSTLFLKNFERIKQANSASMPAPTRMPTDEEVLRAKRRSEAAHPSKALKKNPSVSKKPEINSENPDIEKSKPST